MSIGATPVLPPTGVAAPRVSANPAEQPIPRRFSADEYHRMIEAGVLKESEPVELLAGWIMYKVPRGADKPSLRRWTVEEYERLIDIGVLKESEPVELLEGWIVHKMSRNPPHDTALDKTEDAIRAVLPAGWRLRTQKAIKTADSEPEPDCAIVAGDSDTYSASRPTPADIAFLIEVADTSIATDRTLKGHLYGSAGIPIYWIVNVRDRQVEVYTEPTGATDPPEAAAYRNRQTFRDSESVPVVIRGQTIAQITVASLLPRT
jgi:Uma2 family endonuclease